jgi:ligand-binding SRPBCC domain-containing protein
MPKYVSMTSSLRVVGGFTEVWPNRAAEAQATAAGNITDIFMVAPLKKVDWFHSYSFVNGTMES